MLSTFSLAFCMLLCPVSLDKISNCDEIGRKSSSSPNATVEFLLDYLSVRYPNVDFENLIYVGIKRQELYYIKKGNWLSYTVYLVLPKVQAMCLEAIRHR